MALCRQRGISVLRRTSGGGTVLLDAGCLNYSLILPVAYHPSMASVTLANQYIMEKQRRMLELHGGSSNRLHTGAQSVGGGGGNGGDAKAASANASVSLGGSGGTGGTGGSIQGLRGLSSTLRSEICFHVEELEKVDDTISIAARRSMQMPSVAEAAGEGGAPPHVIVTAINFLEALCAGWATARAAPCRSMTDWTITTTTLMTTLTMTAILPQEQTCSRIQDRYQSKLQHSILNTSH